MTKSQSLRERIDLNTAAVTLRKKLSLDGFAPVDMFAIVKENEDVTLVLHPFSEQISCMGIWAAPKSYLIVINSNLSLGQQHFFVAHVLYHLYIQGNSEPHMCKGRNERGMQRTERHANMFASYFLAPNDSLKMYLADRLNEVPKNPLNLQDVIRVEQHFGMGYESVLVRLQIEGWISGEIMNSTKADVIRLARKMGYSNDLYQPTPEPSNHQTTGKYIRQVEKVKDKGLVSTGKYEELLLEAYRSDMVYGLGIDFNEPSQPM